MLRGIVVLCYQHHIDNQGPQLSAKQSKLCLLYSCEMRMYYLLYSCEMRMYYLLYSCEVCAHYLLYSCEMRVYYLLYSCEMRVPHLKFLLVGCFACVPDSFELVFLGHMAQIRGSIDHRRDSSPGLFITSVRKISVIC